MATSPLFASDAAIQAATQELTQQALRQVDTKWAELVGEQDDPAAKAWLAANAPSGTVGYSNDAYFAATEAERNNPYIYFGSLDQNAANREFVQWAAGIGKSGLAGNAQGVGVGLKDSVVGAVQGLWNLGQAIGSTDAVDPAKQSGQQWEFLLTDPNGYAEAVKQQASAGVDAIAQAAAQGYVDAKLDSLYGGYSGSAAVMTFGLFQVLNPEEKVAVLAQLSKEGKVAKLAELEGEAAKAGRLDEFKLSLANAKSNKIQWVDENAGMGPAAREYNDSAPGARSNPATQKGQAPALERTLPDGTKKLVKFDGVDGDILVDRKLSIVTMDKAKAQALRQSQALAENGFSGRWEVSTEQQAARARKMFSELGVTNINVRVVDPNG